MPNKKRFAPRLVAAALALSALTTLSGCAGGEGDSNPPLEGEYFGTYSPDKFTSEDTTLKFDGDKLEYYVQNCEGYEASSLSKGVFTDDNKYILWTDKGQFKGLAPLSRDASGEVVYIQNQMFFKSGTEKANKLAELHKMSCD